MAKIAKTFRLDETSIENMKLLMFYYQNKFGLKLSQADLLEMLIKQDYKRITDNDSNQVDLFSLN